METSDVDMKDAATHGSGAADADAAHHDNVEMNEDAKISKHIKVDGSSLQEGQASILVKEGEVFYNKVQCFNRDLSIVAIKTFCSIKKDEIRT